MSERHTFEAQHK